MPFFSVSAVRATFAQSFFRIEAIHMVISFSRNWTSSSGSCSPGLQTLPSQSVPPEASTMWMRASARRISSRNWLPRPRPSQAPGTSPAMSMSSTGIRRVLSRHRLLFGLSWILNSGCTHGVRT